MQQEEFYSLIVTYTFQDDNKRDSFRNELKKRHNHNHKHLVELDESTYGVIEGDRNDESVFLTKICEKVGATSSDSVDLFCSGSHAGCEDKKQKIKRIKIIGKH